MTLGAALVPLVPWLLVRILGFSQSTLDFEALGCSADGVRVAAFCTAAAVAAVAFADAAGVRWPKAMGAELTRTYEELFCEPARPHGFVRHLGNAYSNAIYVFEGVLFLACQRGNTSPFCLPDVALGVLAVVHAVASFVWHASNAPKSHYVDLALMNTLIQCIFVRGGCTALSVLLGLRGAAVCFSLIALASAVCNTQHAVMLWSTGLLDDGCPVPCKEIGFRGKGVTTAALFVGRPIGCILMPAIPMCCLRSVGCLPILQLTLAAFALGFAICVFERYALGGVELPKSPWLAAMLSPTAIMHVLSGAALIGSYFHCRSQDLVATQMGL
eukprot:NODE_985_length_1280_cov_222.315918.p2 GENE.NODE_985_length_1280_cov_222.315918~~NODE_985_length_1280_cov_222.315918.p2  ORF type:complete len:383 (-),score=102.18 NODE_985_length_1280_cov_222.315918:118-1104(-)